MLIREFRCGDELALWQIYYSAIHGIAFRNYTPQQIQAWAPPECNVASWTARIQEISPFVAESNGEIVGYADVQASGYIDHFFVSPLVARRGVGSLLMRKILETAAVRATESLFSDVSLNARPFFEHWEFCVEMAQTVLIRGVTLDNFRMRKNLMDHMVLQPDTGLS